MIPAQTKIPGICGAHVVVRDACRQRPVNDWIGDILIRVRRELEAMHRGWPADQGVQFHVAVTLERPGPAAEPAPTEMQRISDDEIRCAIELARHFGPQHQLLAMALEELLRLRRTA